MDPAGLIIIRPGGELAIKSRRTRAAFEKILHKSIRAALARAGLKGQLHPTWGRALVAVDPADQAAACAVLGRVFGIAGLSPVDSACPADLDSIVAHGGGAYRDAVAGRRFAVRARVTQTPGLGNSVINRALGAALNGPGRVDLETPEVTVYVEVRDGRALFFTRRLPGAGGLPVGVEGRAVNLLSGGFDSAVAAWRAMRRGIALTHVFCNLGGPAHAGETLAVARRLARDWDYSTHPRAVVVDFAEPVADMQARVPPAFWQVLLKRLMYRAACRVAEVEGAEALVTGEAVGQASSQTLPNLRAIETAADRPVLRPLLGAEKEEIVAEARHIGTASLSERIKEYCALTPRRPVTRTTPERLDAEEAKLDPGALERAVAARETVRLLDRPAAGEGADVYVDVPPRDATLLALRPEEDPGMWIAPDAPVHEPADLLDGFETRLDPDTPYLLYCPNGTRAAFVAGVMREHGWTADAWRGTPEQLRRHLAGR